MFRVRTCNGLWHRRGVVDGVVVGEEVASVEAPVRHVEQRLGDPHMEDQSDDAPLELQKREVFEGWSTTQDDGSEESLEDEEVIPGEGKLRRDQEPKDPSCSHEA